MSVVSVKLGVPCNWGCVNKCPFTVCGVFVVIICGYLIVNRFFFLICKDFTCRNWSALAQNSVRFDYIQIWLDW